jgi:REP element-mobilizing transposase RayT
MNDPLAYLLTWTCYGTWLPGDARGWVDGVTHETHLGADSEREQQARQLMVQDVVTLNEAERELVAATIRDHCRVRGWPLHAVNVRTNHVHVVVGACAPPDKALREFKAWCTRRLREASPGRERWWTEGGSKRYLWKEESVAAAIAYVVEQQ